MDTKQAQDKAAEAKLALAESKKETKAATAAHDKATKADTKASTPETVKAVKDTLTALNKAIRAEAAKQKAFDNATAQVEKVKAREAKAAEKAAAAASKGDNPGRNALEHSVEITTALCKKHKVPETAASKPTLFAHEYCFANGDKDGNLLRTRKEIVKELRDIGLTKNTAQAQVTSYLKGIHPKGFSGTPAAA